MDRPGDRGAAEDAQQFVEKWSRAELTERAASHEHCLDLCRLLGEPTPASADATGEDYCFEKHVNVVRSAPKLGGVHPSMFGTLFERILDPRKRAQIGAS
jgi:hypothetical protein